MIHPSSSSKPLWAIIFVLLLSSSGFAQGVTDDDESGYLIKKGRFYSALTFSLSQRNAENEDQLLRQVINQDRYTFRVVGNGGYALKDNFTLGLLVGFGESREEITFLDENENEITSKRLQRGVTIAPTMRNYIPIGEGQFQIVVQTQLGITSGESLQRVFNENDINKTEGNFIDLELGVSPGLIVFFDRHWAFETTVGVAGFSTRTEEEVTNGDQENRQRIVTSNIDLRINLLQLNLGVAYYF